LPGGAQAAGPQPAASAVAPGKLPVATAAIVDYQRILRDAKAAQSIRDQIEARRKAYLDQLSKEEQRLHLEDERLAKQRAVLAPDVFAQQRDAFEEQVQAAQRLAQEKRRELEAASQAALNSVRQVVVEIVDKMADERGFNLVLPSSGVLLFSPKIDLTDEVLQRLDQTLPTVKVPPDQPK
jgi:Skp family chaperone for outer membrane proteins